MKRWMLCFIMLMRGKYLNRTSDTWRHSSINRKMTICIIFPGILKLNIWIILHNLKNMVRDLFYHYCFISETNASSIPAKCLSCKNRPYLLLLTEIFHENQYLRFTALHIVPYPSSTVPKIWPWEALLFVASAVLPCCSVFLCILSSE